MPKVLVTGATGLLGSALTRRLIHSGADVRIFRRENSPMGALEDVAGEVEHAVGDLRDGMSLRSAMQGVDQVYHTAARVSFGGRADHDLLMRVNVDGTAHVVDAALEAGVSRLVHTSSMAALGAPDRSGAILNEKAEWHRARALTVYARSKYLSELQIHRGVAEGLDAVIVNPALIFGDARPGTSMYRVIERIRESRQLPVPEGGTNVVDVLDVVRGVLRAMDVGRTGERYFLGSENLSWKRIVETLAGAFGTAPPCRVISRRTAMSIAWASEFAAALSRTNPVVTREMARRAAHFYHYANTKAVEELGCTFRPFEETATRLAARFAMDGSPAVSAGSPAP